MQGLSVLALITARGGSKGLPAKNLLRVQGRPLIDFTIAAARAAACVDRVVLSTDDDEIARVAEACGCEVPFRRPAALATDTAKSMDVVLHALDQLPNHDVLVLLQPTSPARIGTDIDATVQQMLDSNAQACVTVCEVEENPYWMFRIDSSSRLLPLLETPTATRRQDLPPAFLLNGAVYAARTDALRQLGSFLSSGTVAHVMPRERSIDIDNLENFESFARGATVPRCTDR